MCRSSESAPSLFPFKLLLVVAIALSMAMSSCELLQTDIAPKPRDELQEIPGDGSALEDYRLEGRGRLENQYLERAFDTVAQFRILTRDDRRAQPVFLLHTRPLTTHPAYWTAMGGTQQVLNIFVAHGAGQGGCLLPLLPIPEDGVWLMPGGGVDDADDNDADEDDAPPLDEEDEGEAPPLDPLPEEPIIVRPNDGKRCGTISTIRSLLKMGWITAADAVEGDNLKPSKVREFDRYLRHDGLTPAKQQEAHSDNTPQDRTFEAKEYDINHLEGEDANKDSWKEIDEALAAGKDCIISYIIKYKDLNGVDRSVSHAEMLTDVTRSNGNVTAEMQDALDQGTGGGNGIKKEGQKRTQNYNNRHKNADNTEQLPITVYCYGAS